MSGQKLVQWAQAAIRTLDVWANFFSGKGIDTRLRTAVGTLSERPLAHALVLWAAARQEVPNIFFQNHAF